MATVIDQLVEADASADPDLRCFWKKSMELVAGETMQAINELVQSPIERLFIRSLVLSFLNANGLGLLVHRSVFDAAAEVDSMRRAFEESQNLVAWFPDYRPQHHLGRLLDGEFLAGRMPLDEWSSVSALFARFLPAHADRSYYMTLQPRFPDVLIGGRSVRPDLLFWLPAHPEVRIIVECDGFSFHSGKDKFITDRQRDRAFLARGYEVMRFAGPEIHRDPLEAAWELATFLWERSAAVESLVADAR